MTLSYSMPAEPIAFEAPLVLAAPPGTVERDIRAPVPHEPVPDEPTSRETGPGRPLSREPLPHPHAGRDAV